MKREWLRQNIGLLIVALWSIVLGIQSLSSMLLVAPIDQNLTDAGSVLVFRALSGIFSLAFFTAAGGLFWRRPWARILFQVAVVAFFAVSLFGLLASAPNSFSPGQKWLRGGRFALSAILPVIYLNWSPIKAKFFQPEENQSDQEEMPDHD